ncbi:MAG TPA: hypothetical protein VGF48_24145 [Thermoanaerobaculia bacterium]|jgi:hypothetical protein
MPKDQDKDNEIIHRGPITEFRPHADHVSGGSDKSVQKEALGAEGIEDLSATSGTSGGAPGGKISEGDSYARPRRDGGEREDNRDGNLTR